MNFRLARAILPFLNFLLVPGSAVVNESAVIYVYSTRVENSMEQIQVPTIRICCELSEILTPGPDFECTTAQSSTEDPVTLELLNLTEAWSNIWTGFPICASGEYEWRVSDKLFTLSEGVLQLPGPTSYEPGQFCVHKTIQDDEYVFVALTCPKKNWQSIFYTILQFSSAAFLLMALVHHLKNKRHQYTSLHNGLQVTYVVMLLAAFTFLATFGVLKVFTVQPRDEVCAWLAIALHFTFISAFMWLTAINLDLWLLFGCRKGLVGAPNAGPIPQKAAAGANTALLRKKVGKIIVVALAGVVLPILFTWQKEHFEFTTISVFTNLLKANATKTGENDTEADANPADEANCFHPTKFPYLYAPVCILLLVNFLFHSATLISARKQKPGARTELQAHVNIKYWKMLSLFTKLFALTTLLWFLEFTHWAAVMFDSYAYTEHMHTRIWNNVAIIVNCVAYSHGMAVFVIYVWQDNLYRRIRGKFTVLASRLPKSAAAAGAAMATRNGEARLEAVSVSEEAVRVSSSQATQPLPPAPVTELHI